MNIFATSPFPAESAICLPDKHIVKMPLESKMERRTWNGKNLDLRNFCKCNLGLLLTQN